jgi:hypothetical protein
MQLSDPEITLLKNALAYYINQGYNREDGAVLLKRLNDPCETCSAWSDGDCDKYGLRETCAAIHK